MEQPSVDTSLVSIAGAEHWAWTDGDCSEDEDLGSRQQSELEADLVWLGQRCCDGDKCVEHLEEQNSGNLPECGSTKELSSFKERPVVVPQELPSVEERPVVVPQELPSFEERPVVAPQEQGKWTEEEGETNSEVEDGLGSLIETPTDLQKQLMLGSMFGQTADHAREQEQQDAGIWPGMAAAEEKPEGEAERQAPFEQAVLDRKEKRALRKQAKVLRRKQNELLGFASGTDVSFESPAKERSKLAKAFLVLQSSSQRSPSSA